LKAAQEQRKKMLMEAQQHAFKIVEEAKVQARVLHEKAQADVEEILRKGHAQAHAETERAFARAEEKLMGKIGDLVGLALETYIATEWSQEGQRRMLNAWVQQWLSNTEH
jgi:F0F1-type ATP synthase membrane subunit b/b'